MLPMEQFRIVRVKQKATAASKDYTVSLGWTPDLIEIFNLKDGGRVAVAVRETTGAGQVTLQPTDSAAMDVDAANGITFLENGFRFGQNGLLQGQRCKSGFQVLPEYGVQRAL